MDAGRRPLVVSGAVRRTHCTREPAANAAGKRLSWVAAPAPWSVELRTADAVVEPRVLPQSSPTKGRNPVSSKSLRRMAVSSIVRGERDRPGCLWQHDVQLVAHRDRETARSTCGRTTAATRRACCQSENRRRIQRKSEPVHGESYGATGGSYNARRRRRSSGEEAAVRCRYRRPNVPELGMGRFTWHRSTCLRGPSTISSEHHGHGEGEGLRVRSLRCRDGHVRPQVGPGCGRYSGSDCRQSRGPVRSSPTHSPSLRRLGNPVCPGPRYRRHR